jgi:hypothetical protein
MPAGPRPVHGASVRRPRGPLRPGRPGPRGPRRRTGGSPSAKRRRAEITQRRRGLLTVDRAAERPQPGRVERDTLGLRERGDPCELDRPFVELGEVPAHLTSGEDTRRTARPGARLADRTACTSASVSALSKAAQSKVPTTPPSCPTRSHPPAPARGGRGGRRLPTPGVPGGRPPGPAQLERIGGDVALDGHPLRLGERLDVGRRAAGAAARAGYADAAEWGRRLVVHGLVVDVHDA